MALIIHPASKDLESFQHTVLTNGCFDILHIGHIRLLQYAKALAGAHGTVIVALNSDSSVKRLKGSARPVYPLVDRIAFLEALHFVDVITWYENDSPETVIQKVKPKFLLKGGDYSIDKIIGASFVKSYGGHVKIFPYQNGHSTSELARKISSL